MKHRAAIIRNRQMKRPDYKTKFELVLVVESETLADIAIKLDELEQKAEDTDEDWTYHVYFATTR